MLDYILIGIAVVCFAAQFAFTKIYEGKVKQTFVTALSLLIFTSLIGTLLFFVIGKFQVEFSWFSGIMAAAFALIMIPYFVVGIKILSLGSLAIYSLFMMLGGMLLPFFYGIAFLQEEASIGKIAGCILLTACMILQGTSQETSGEKIKSKWLYYLLCMVGFVVNGMTGVIAKAHQVHGYGREVDEVSFTVISCGLTAVFSLILLIPYLLGNEKKEKICEFKSTLALIPFACIGAIGVASYMGNFLHLKAATTVPASVQFPIVSGGVIVLSALVSRVIFREKISMREWVAIGGAFVATFLFMY